METWGRVYSRYMRMMQEGGEDGVRRATTREDIRRKLANFGEDPEEEEEEVKQEATLNNNLEVRGGPLKGTTRKIFVLRFFFSIKRHLLVPFVVS